MRVRTPVPAAPSCTGTAAGRDPQQGRPRLRHAGGRARPRTLDSTVWGVSPLKGAKAWTISSGLRTGWSVYWSAGGCVGAT